MDEPKQPSLLVTWALAVVVPVLAGLGAWLLSNATISTPACAGGAGGAGAGVLAALGLLLAAGPATTAWRVRRATAGEAMFPVMLSIFLSLITVYMGAQVSWVSHDCMT